MSKDDVDQVQGELVTKLPDTNFRVTLEDGQVVLGHLCGKARLHVIRSLPGDKRTLELTLTI